MYGGSKGGGGERIGGGRENIDGKEWQREREDVERGDGKGIGCRGGCRW